MDFELLPLNDLLTTIIDNRGKTCPTADRGIPLIATNCISNDRLYPSYDKLRFVSQQTYTEWFRGHPKPGDIIFVNKGTPGRCCWVPDPVDFCIAQDMVALRVDEKKVYPKFLFALLRSNEVQNLIANMHVGTLIPHFKKGDFDKLLLKIPLNRKLQEFFGDIYFDISKRVELNQRMNGTLEGIAQALFKSWFVDFDPVKAKAEGYRPEGMDDATAALFPSSFSESSLGLIPEGWKAIPFSEMIQLIGGGTPKTSVSEYWGGSILWFSVTDAPDESDVFVINTEKKITQSGLDNSSAKLLPTGTTIITARGTVGRIALVGVPMAMNQSCYGIRGISGIGDFFIYYTTKALLSRLKSITHGSVFDTITRDTFTSVSFVRPPSNIVDRFESQVAPLLKRIQSNLYTISTLKTIRDLLLPRLISGKLRVSDLPKETAAS